MARIESTLKTRLMKVIRTSIKAHEMPGYVVIRHEDRFTAGVPDFTLSGASRTSWWEVKHGDPEIESKGLQDLMCLRLANASYCRHIIYLEDKDGRNKRTLIVHPRNLEFLSPVDREWIGHVYQPIVDFMVQVHEAR